MHDEIDVRVIIHLCRNFIPSYNARTKKKVFSRCGMILGYRTSPAYRPEIFRFAFSVLPLVLVFLSLRAPTGTCEQAVTKNTFHRENEEN